MFLIKYLNHTQQFFASVLPSILRCAKISSKSWVKVGRGVVVPTETEVEEEAVAVEGGADTASPRSDLLPILSRTPTYVSLPPYRGGKLRPLPERCASATVDSRGWRH